MSHKKGTLAELEQFVRAGFDDRYIEEVLRRRKRKRVSPPVEPVFTFIEELPALVEDTSSK